MIDRMTRYDFILLSGNKDSFLESLTSLGVMDVTRSSKPVDEKSAALLSEAEAVSEEISRIEKGVDARLKSLEAERDTLAKEAQACAVWGEYDRARLDELGIPVAFHCVPEKKFDPSWHEQYAIQEVAREKGKVWFVALGESDVPAPVLPAPSRSVAEVERDIEAKEAEIEAYKKQLESLKDTLPSLHEKLTGLRREMGLYLASVGGESAADGGLTVFEGFAPSSEDERLAKAFDELDCVWFASKANVEDNPPIKLKNNKFVKQFEVLTDMYGRPDYNEFDPTPYLSIFFLLFFAMCMGDAGYGILLIVTGILLRKVQSLKNLAPLVTILGVGTLITGIVMHTFFGYDITTLPWIPSWLKAVMITGTIAGFEAQMVLSLVVGVIHLCLAMVVKTVYATRNKGFLGSLGVWGWTVLIVGGVIVAALAMFKLLPSNVVKWIVIALGVLSALGIFLFNDIHRNPLKNIGSGLWETYNTATGLLGDVLSYLRLYALGLAGGMLGKAFNNIASMTLGDGSFGIGWLFFVIILVVGHALNFAMCCLGAFVHPLRLNFLEFFKNSGYDGKGRKYDPLV
ncbi:MAG: ATPase V [Bacteroidales bacterium]|nr:ATPase V [Bacteroidales bacterium]